MAGPEQEMYFFIADISGYTAYMLQNQTDFTHGTLIIKALMEALIKEANFPLEISKLEGDAIFFYMMQEKLPHKYREQPTLIGKKLLEFFRAFYEKLHELIAATTCTCGGCSNIQELKLKMVAHYGKAALTQIGSFTELSGVDVIIPHRLLKNQIQSKCYLLMTEGAYQQHLLEADTKVDQGQEQDKDLGTLQVYVYYPPTLPQTQPASASSWQKNLAHLKLGLGEKLIKWGLIKKPHFENFPQQKN